MSPILRLLPLLRSLASHFQGLLVKVARKLFAVLASIADICSRLEDVPIVIVLKLQIAVRWWYQGLGAMGSCKNRFCEVNSPCTGASDRSLGFEDEDLGSSPGWWASTVATYCPSRRGNYPNSYLRNLANDLPPRAVQRFIKMRVPGCEN